MLGASGRLSIIIPALDEAPIIVETLAALVPLRARGAEVIVVDSGSNDSTPALARTFADRVISAPRNRGAAMNAGAALASGDVFLFLHADTIVPDNADRLIASALARRFWGRFDLRIAGRHPHRRAGDLRQVRSIPKRRRLCRSAADGRHRAVAKAQALLPAILHHDAGGHFGPALGLSRRPSHDRAYVAAAPCLLLRRCAGAPCARLRPRADVTRAERRPAIASGRRADIAAAARLPRRGFARHARPSADRRGRRAPARPYRPCLRQRSLPPVWH